MLAASTKESSPAAACAAGGIANSGSSPATRARTSVPMPLRIAFGRRRRGVRCGHPILNGQSRVEVAHSPPVTGELRRGQARHRRCPLGHRASSMREKQPLWSRTCGTYCHDSISAPTWPTDALTISYRRGCQPRYGRLTPDSLRVLDLSFRGIQVDVTFCLPMVEICSCSRTTVTPRTSLIMHALAGGRR